MSQDEFDFEGPPKKTAAEISRTVLEKIKKLLRLSSSPNPNEAALAMGKAQALADQHNLDLSSLSEDEEVADVIHQWFPAGARITQEQRCAINIVHNYFNVTACWGRQRFILVGKELDITIAEYVIAFLVSACRRCLKGYEADQKLFRRRMTPRKRHSFKAGFFYGVSHQLSRGRASVLLENQKFALVLSEQREVREEKLNDLVGETTEIDTRKKNLNQSAMTSGFIAGRDTQINPGLSSRSTLLRLNG